MYLNNLNRYVSLNYIKKKKIKINYFALYTHKKLMYFSFLQKNKLFNYSAGQLFGHKLKKIKSFKKSILNYNYTINLLNKKFQKPIKLIQFFFCKNFSLKHYLWLKKFFFLNKVVTEFLIVTHSWNIIKKKKRRIKRKIYKKLLKNS